MSPANTTVADIQTNVVVNGSHTSNAGDTNARGVGNVNVGNQAQASGAQSPSSSGAQIRSRITVVCAECKRLKLRCDRRTPCGSCLKRDTVQRCTYSAAAAEKIDVQSLHNRILVLESQLISFQSNPALVSGSSGVCQHNTGYDRALVAVGQCGSSLVIPPDDVSAIWLDHLDLRKDGIELRPAIHPPALEADPSAVDLYALVAQLPKDPFRSLCMTQLEATLLMHPCLNFPTFKARVLDMFKCSEGSPASSSSRTGGLDFGGSTSMGGGASVPRGGEQSMSMSFFASAAAGFAIGAHCLLEASGGTLPSSPMGPSAAPRPGSNHGRRKDANMTYSHTNGINSHNVVSDTKLSNFVSASSPQSDRENEMSKKRQHSASHMSSHNIEPGTPRSLFALSEHALRLHSEHLGHSSFDPDFLHALILQVLYLLHAPDTRGPAVAHKLFCLVGGMVNVARVMGLGVDPDDFGNSENHGESLQSHGFGLQKVKREEGTSVFTLFEKEMRRRLWWDVFYYDLFVSDCMGQPPLITDDVYTTQLPTDVDEEHFEPNSVMLPPPHDESPQGNIGYFIQKCRLAQLVKNMKKRTFRDPLSTNTLDPSVDAVVTFEAEVHQWLADLPDKFKLNMDPNMSNIAPLPIISSTLTSSPLMSLPTSSTDSRSAPSSMSPPPAPSATFSDLLSSASGPDSLFFVAQRCELASVANRLILKLFLPFIRPGRFTSSGIPAKAPPQAVLATVNAAHTIVHASRILHTVFRKVRPATYAFYSFARTLFDAAVISANNIIQQPQSIYARIAMEDVRAALEVLRDPAVSTGQGLMSGGGGGVEGTPSEAVRVIEVLKAKAEAARSGSGAVSAGMKRKHQDMDDGALALGGGFQLPFVGGGVVSASSPQDHARSSLQPGDYESNSPSRPGGSSSRMGTASHVRTKYSNGSEKDMVSWPPGAAESSSPLTSIGAKFSVPKERASKSQHPTVGVRARTTSTKGENQRSRTSSTTSARHHVAPPPPPPPPPSAVPSQRANSVLEPGNPYQSLGPPPPPTPTRDVMQDEQNAQDSYPKYREDVYGAGQASFEPMYRRPPSQPQNMYNQYGANSSTITPTPNSHPYYSGYSPNLQQAEYNATIAGHSMVPGMGLPASTPAMDTSGMGLSLPNTPQEPSRFAMAPEKNTLDRQESGPHSFGHRHPQNLGHQQTPMSGQDPMWSETNGNFPSNWDGYTFWKGEPS